VSRLLLFWMLACRPLLAHRGLPLEPHDLWTADAWRWDPVLVICLAASAALYWFGAKRERGFSGRERASFFVGWVILVLALQTPLHPIGEVLFSVHMVQHELLMIVAAPLIVFGRPLLAALFALPPAWRRPTGALTRQWIAARTWAGLSTPLSAFVIHGVVLWVWHVPALLQAGIDNDWVHSAQHLSFLASALLFWWSLIRKHGAERHYGMAALYLFVTMLHTSLLGTLLTFSQVLWYPAYEGNTEAWGLTPLEDQQIAGLIMWIPASTVYVVAALSFVARWFGSFEERARQGLT
jgi:putative membrane protein